jgi:beta-galactosidase
MLSLLPLFADAQVRERQTINSGWQFLMNDSESISSDEKWARVNIPHTWNALDILDETPGFRRGIAWYRKEIFISRHYQGRHLQLFLEAVSNRATVFINGKKISQHDGGFTGFAIDLSPHVVMDSINVIDVRVDNRKELSTVIPPFSGDFNLMGGIYRDVWLVSTSPFHFKGAGGSEGVRFHTPFVSAERAAFKIAAEFTGNVGNKSGYVKYELWLKNELKISGSKKFSTSDQNPIELDGEISLPKLWSPESPVLYQLHVSLYNDDNKLLDEVYYDVGFRWFGFNDKKEFLLNGKPYKLKGASRHQDYHRLGFALPEALHWRDMELMKEMGCNFIRIAHYPQDPAIYEACDKLGLIAWSEIPVVDRVPANDSFHNNSLVMMEEMIHQQFNHPSIAIWGYHNEVRNLDQFSLRNARSLDSLARKLDPQRLTAIAFESNMDAPYFKDPLAKEMLGIAMINGYNIYQGWYRGKHQDIGKFLDMLYAMKPGTPVMISEYGAGSMRNIHSYNTSIFDFSEEYQVEFQRSYLKEGNKRPWMIGYAIWNFIDFQVDGRQDVSPNINNKGMVTTDRQRKDAFYYYRSQWSKEPFVHIAGKSWQERIAVAGKNKTLSIPVTVFSNQQEVELYLNNILLGKRKSSDGSFTWMVNVSHGKNSFFVKTPGGRSTDHFQLHYRFIDSLDLYNRFTTPLHFNTGQTRTYFTDVITQEQWLPDKPYTKGTWGYTGGIVYNSWPGNSDWNGVREGIHLPVKNTENEPLFQTFVEGLDSWKADLPAGRYRVRILLNEPFSEQQRKNVQRRFDIFMNGSLWKKDLDLAKEFGALHAVMMDKEVVVKDKEGITINFIQQSGRSILNGVSIIKL